MAQIIETGNIEILQVGSSLESSEKFLQRKYLRSGWGKRVMLLESLKQG